MNVAVLFAKKVSMLLGWETDYGYSHTKKLKSNMELRPIMQKSRLFLSSVITALVSFNICQGDAIATITTDYDKTVPFAYVPAIGNWTTTGAMMDDMQISVTLAGSSQASTPLLWGSNSTFSGVSSGTYGVGDGWRLYLQNPLGSTFVTSFVFEVWGDMDVTNLLINALPGDTVFDVDVRFDDSGFSTIDSKDGNPFVEQYVNGNGFTRNPVQYSGVNIAATYGTLVALNGKNPVEDLYATLSLSFDNTSDSSHLGFSSLSSLRFISDTDTVNNNPVPEPSTLLLLGIGVSALVGRKIHRRNQ